MSARPGAPTGVEDILTEILAELRAITALLGQDMVITTNDTLTVESVIEEAPPWCRYRDPQGNGEPAHLAAQELRP